MAVVLYDGYPQAEGAKWGAVADVSGPSSYATGGFSLAAVSFGMSALEYVSSGGISSNGTYRLHVLDNSTSAKPASSLTAKAYVVSTGAEVTAATDLSGAHFTVLARGL